MIQATIRAELRPADVTAIVDTREQLPFCLDPLKAIAAMREALEATNLFLEACAAVIALGEPLSLEGLHEAAERCRAALALDKGGQTP